MASEATGATSETVAGAEHGTLDSQLDSPAVSSSADEDGMAEVEIAISDLLDGALDDTDGMASVANQVRRIDVRGALNRERVDAYKLAIKRGDRLPAILIAEVDGMPYVASGWHRTVATAESGITTVRAKVKKLSRTEAVDMAIEENRRHGHSPTPADVAKSLEAMWEVHPDRIHWSNVRLAEVCGVSEKQVRAAEAFLKPSWLEARGKKRLVMRNGMEYEQQAPVSSTTNEDGWQATKRQAKVSASTSEQAKAVQKAFKLAEQAVDGLHAVGLDDMPDEVASWLTYGITAETRAAKAATAMELADVLASLARTVYGKEG